MRGALAVVFVSALIFGVPGIPNGLPGAGPNIVLVLTDDQRWDTLWAMSIVERELAGKGVSFANAFAENPLCCPSRATVLTGQFSHTTGIYKNSPPNGGFQDFVDGSTIATWLQARGYRTGLIGKYMNGYSTTNGEYVPPGWSRWVAHSGGGQYFGYMLSVDGINVAYGQDESDYSTDVFAGYGREFITTTPARQPLFLYFAPHAPHGLTDLSPPIPAPRHAGTFDGLPPWRPPSYNEADISDKPAWMQGHELWTPDDQAAGDAYRIGQLESLLAVDEAVGAILDALTATGRIGNTLLVFASDNGYLWGEHRLDEKNVPYEESIRLPLVVRFDALGGRVGRIDRHLVINADLAPTLAAAAGILTPDVEGMSLLPLLSSRPRWREDFLVEHSGATAPPFCQVRSATYAYVHYATGEEELYDLVIDPYQLDDRSRDQEYSAVLLALRARERILCVPPPPGFPS
jgi:N-acetylglucosamine-6-sulfatase